jgi:repressor LexA
MCLKPSSVALRCDHSRESGDHEEADVAGHGRGRSSGSRRTDDDGAPPELAPVTEIPDGPPDESGLTQRQRRVLEVIRDAVTRRGYPPSMREIGEAVGLTSPSSVAHQLTTLERKGYLRRDPNRPRAIFVVAPEERADGMDDAAAPDAATAPFDETGAGDARPLPSYVPVVGRIAAGRPDPRGASGRGRVSASASTRR